MFLALLGLALSACEPVDNVGFRLAGSPPPAAAATPHFTDREYIATDGARLPLRRWLPPGEVKAVILALHGFGDYSHAFAIPAPLWAADGIATYAYDQRGFGAAPGRGLWAGEGRLALDTIVASRTLRQIYPGRPIYLLGESMGGAVAVLAANGAMRGVVAGPQGMPTAPVDGVILSAPAVWGRATMGFLPRLALFAGVRLFPDMVLTGSSLHILASDNLPMLRALSRDPLVLKGARVATVYGLVNLMDDALAAAPHLTMPTLLMYGARDQVVPRLAMAAFAARLPSARGGADRLAYYPHGYHLLLRDLDGATVARDVASWIFDRKAPLPSQADARDPGMAWPPTLAQGADGGGAMPLAQAGVRR